MSETNKESQTNEASAKESENLTLEFLNENHKKQRKELQAKVQSLKKSVTKGDKKKKKEIDAEIAILEKEFEDKCELEVKNLEQKLKSLKTTDESSVTEKKDNVENDEAVQGDEKPNKLSKNKKRKEKKEKEEQEREKLIALQEIENKKGPAYLELTKINEKLKKRGLKLKEMISDGNCMYYSISDQLKSNSIKTMSCKELRELACDFMLKNPNEFQPYINVDDDILDEQKYEEYCLNIRDTLVWGGQVELKALSDVLNVVIEVVQAEGSEIIIGDSSNSNKDKLIITYHRHMLGSGEHYNSTERDLKKTEDDD